MASVGQNGGSLMLTSATVAEAAAVAAGRSTPGAQGSAGRSSSDIVEAD